MFSQLKISQNWEEICRLCATHSELNQTSQELSQIILKHLSVMIKNDDGLSTKVCHKCEEKVTDFHNFFEECERIQSMFVDYKNMNTSLDQDFDFENCNDVKIKEELNYDETENIESCNEFAEAIESSEKLHIKNKGKSTYIKKEKIYLLKYNCHVCETDCKNWAALCSHTEEEHKTKPQIKCLCDKILNNIRTIRCHERMHNPEKCLKCNTCLKTFPSKWHLTSHEYSHLPKTDKSCVCNKCFKKFSNPPSLKMHKYRFHKLHSERSKWPCELCDMKLASKEGLASHVKTVHQKLKSHMCEICGRSFASKLSLSEHRVLHSSERNFACDKCDKTFKTKRVLQIHIRSHSNTFYQCPHCPALLKNRDTLKNHLHVHDETRDVICPVCGRGMKTKNNLRTHMKIHKGELQIKCKWCPQMYSNRSSYDLHKKIKHPTEFEIESTNKLLATSSGENKDTPKKIIRTTLKSNRIHIL